MKNRCDSILSKYNLIVFLLFLLHEMKEGAFGLKSEFHFNRRRMNQFIL